MVIGHLIWTHIVDLCTIDLYFKTTCYTRPHFQGSIGGLKLGGPLYSVVLIQ